MSRPITTLVLSRFPPHRPKGGAALRNCQNIHALSQLGPVDVVTIGPEAPSIELPFIRSWTSFPAPSDPGGAIGGMRRLARKVRSLSGYHHPLVSPYYSREIARQLQQRVHNGHHDLIVIEELSLALYAPDLRGGDRRVVFDAHNIESPLRAQIAEKVGHLRGGLLTSLRTKAQLRCLRRIENSVIARSDLVWVCSHEDAAMARRVCHRTRSTTVLPNGVNVGEYASYPGRSSADSWPAGPITLTFPGTFGYAPNEQAALCLIREIVPAIRARDRKVRLVLVGRDPTEAMHQARGLDTDIEITGAVESVLPYLRAPTIVVVPLQTGGGTRLKILEAFAADRPVVSTTKGVEGIEAVDGAHLLVRESPQSIADAVLHLWETPTERHRLCAAASSLVRERYSWEAAARTIAASLRES